MLEAQDDSYTDYERMSINTGLPTVIGWTVHEWFWRNDYVIVASRINDVKTIYDSDIYNSSDNFYTVKSGDYLIKIAEELKFGNWENIYNLNKNQILNPSLIYANQKLVISNNADKQVNMSKLNEIKILLKKYNIAYVYIGGLERQKYLNLNEEKFNKLGKLIYSEGNTQIYKIN